MSESYKYDFGRADFIPVDIDSARLGTVIVPIAFVRDEKAVTIHGTSFCVAKFDSGEALFVTARHVVEPIIANPEIDARILLPSGPAADDGRRSLVTAPIIALAASATYSDVAVLIVDMAELNRLDKELYRLYVLPVTFAAPQIDQYCMALGYGQEPGISDYNMQASRGMVEEVHPRRRDNFLSTFPSFRTSALYKHGMSGGPIVNINGCVIGVISHGTEADEAENVVGYGASIGAILELQLVLHDVAGTSHNLSVVRLADMGYLGNREDPAITLTRADNGLTLTWKDSYTGDG
jgi:Trypsin-like peptidase domain